MPFDDAIRAAAERCGVQQEFWDTFGKLHITDTETNSAILTALGFDCSNEQTLAASIAARKKAERSRVLPPVMVVLQNEPISIPGLRHFEVHREDGGVQSSFDELPLGYHDVKAAGETMRLIVCPDCAYPPEAGKHAGLGVTLYGVRSVRNWGCGDFRDLRDLIDWAIPNLHADFIALNQLHAIHNRIPYTASPYLPNSIFYRNFQYLDVEAVPGYTPDLQNEPEIARLRATEIVQYEKVAALKRRALERIYKTNPLSP